MVSIVAVILIFLGWIGFMVGFFYTFFKINPLSKILSYYRRTDMESRLEKFHKDPLKSLTRPVTYWTKDNLQYLKRKC